MDPSAPPKRWPASGPTGPTGSTGTGGAVGYYGNFYSTATQTNPVASTANAKAPSTSKAARAAASSFKQYREKDGLFYFKLVDSQGRVLLQSLGFASPKEAGLAIGQLQQNDAKALAEMGAQVSLGEGVATSEVTSALELLRAELAEKAKSKA